MSDDSKTLEFAYFRSMFNMVDDEDSCWEWFNAERPNYGRYRNRQAHRMMWELTFGPIPKGMLILHKCDNSICVRPKHLMLGSHSDNMMDLKLKNSWGIEVRLTKQQIDDIVVLHKDNWDYRRIAYHMKLENWVVWRVLHYKGATKK